MTYTVYGAVRSRTLRVLWTLEELGADYRHVATPPRSDEIRTVNPTGKIPALVVDGVALHDSVAIMTFLSDRHATLTAEPGTVARARQDGFIHQVNDEIDALLWAAARHSFVLPEERRVPEIKKSLRWEFSRTQNAVADRMEIGGPFVAGEAISIADILLSHCIGWAMNAKFEVTNERLIKHNTMMRARPAFKAALARDSQP